MWNGASCVYCDGKRCTVCKRKGDVASSNLAGSTIKQ